MLMSGSGPSRHAALPHNSGRFRGEADMKECESRPPRTNLKAGALSAEIASALPLHALRLRYPPTVFSRTRGWISLYDITGVCARKRSTMPRTNGRMWPEVTSTGDSPVHRRGTKPRRSKASRLDVVMGVNTTPFAMETKHPPTAYGSSLLPLFLSQCFRRKLARSSFASIEDEYITPFDTVTAVIIEKPLGARPEQVDHNRKN
jgi:hypothetical protein